jgi:hypothetical protein
MPFARAIASTSGVRAPAKVSSRRSRRARAFFVASVAGAALLFAVARVRALPPSARIAETRARVAARKYVKRALAK